MEKLAPSSFEWFELTDYNSKGNGKLRSECKRAKGNMIPHAKKFGHVTNCIRLLPTNENYVGSTNNLRSRISEHKHKKKRECHQF